MPITDIPILQQIKDMLDIHNLADMFNVSGETMRVYWHQIVQGVQFQTPAGQKVNTWDARDFTSLDLILDPQNTIQVYQKGIDKDHPAIEMIERHGTLPNGKEGVIGYAKIGHIENVLFDDLKILRIENGLSMNNLPTNQNITQLSPQRKVIGQIKRFIDPNWQFNCLGTTPRLTEVFNSIAEEDQEKADSFFMYCQQVVPIYNFKNEFLYTEITLVIVNDLYAKSGKRVSDFVREGGAGDGVFHAIDVPVFDADGNIINWEIKWDVKKLKPTGVNSYNLELQGRGAISSFTMWGCEWEYVYDVESGNPIISYGPHKILIGYDAEAPYFNSLSPTPQAEDHLVCHEGCIFEQNFWWDKWTDYYKGNVDYSNQTNYQGSWAFAYEGNDIKKEDLSNSGCIYFEGYKVKVGRTFDQSGAVNIFANLKDAEGGKEYPMIKDSKWIWDTKANPYFHNDLVGQQTWQWPKIELDFATWFFVNGLLLINQLVIRPVYHYQVNFNLYDIPVLGGFLNWITGGFVPSWRIYTEASGVNQMPIPMVFPATLWNWGKGFYWKTDNKGLIPATTLDNEDSNFKMVGQDTFTLSIFQALTDKIRMQPVKTLDGTWLPEEEVDTSYLGQTTYDSAGKSEKFYGIQNDGTNLNFKLNTVYPNKTYIVEAVSLKAPARVNYQLSFFKMDYSDPKNPDYPNQSNLVWQATYQTNGKYRSNMTTFSDIISLASYNKPDLPPLDWPKPLLQPTPEGMTKRIDLDKGSVRLIEHQPNGDKFGTLTLQPIIPPAFSLADVYRGTGIGIEFIDNLKIKCKYDDIGFGYSVPILDKYKLTKIVIITGGQDFLYNSDWHIEKEKILLIEYYHYYNNFTHGLTGLVKKTAPLTVEINTVTNPNWDTNTNIPINFNQNDKVAIGQIWDERHPNDWYQFNFDVKQVLDTQNCKANMTTINNGQNYISISFNSELFIQSSTTSKPDLFNNSYYAVRVKVKAYAEYERITS